jgi:FdhD protein
LGSTLHAGPTAPQIIVSSFHGEARAFAARRRLSRTTLLAILETMRGNDAIYRAAGSVQAAALFQGSELLLSVEDVSRRNCFDIITGILYTSGRLTAEVVMKAANNAVPTIITRKGITSGCFDMATRLGMTLIGHAAPHRYICYAGPEFFDSRA